MTTIADLNTGYQPAEPDYSGVNKIDVFSGFIRAKYLLRKYSKLNRDFRNNKRDCEQAKEQATRAGDLAALREASYKLERNQEWLTRIAGFLDTLTKDLLDYAHWVEKVADFSEQATLLGLSDTAYRNALKPYGDDMKTGFTLILSHMPDGREDPDIEWRVTAFIIDLLHSNPRERRKTSMFLNEMFGQDFFPVEPAPKPSLSVVEVRP